MRRAFIQTALAAAILIAAPAAHAIAQPVPAEELQSLRTRIESRYDVVPLAGGVALTPKSPRGDVRLIEISDTIAINGVQVSGRELRERVGADADTILRLSYLDRNDLRKLFVRTAPEGETRPEREPAIERATPSTPPAPEPPRRPIAPLEWRSRAGVRLRGRQRR